MTEEEAKTKVCCGPLAVGAAVVLTGAAMAGAPVGSDGPSNCIGSACMAWRWELEHDGTFNATYDARGDWREVERIPNFRKTDRGFCGLAGRPA